MKPIIFRHHYYKLAKPEFTTIRGKGQLKRLKVGQTVSIECRAGITFDAVITKLEGKCVCQMALDFLKADAEYPGCTISTHQQFVNLLNSFRAPHWARVTLESELAIITLQKTAWLNRCIKAECVPPGHCNCEACIAERRGDDHPTCQWNGCGKPATMIDKHNMYFCDRCAQEAAAYTCNLKPL